MALLWEEVRLATSRSAEEVEARLAAATAAWAGDHHGRSVPAPPWASDRFVAVERTESFWLALPIVVAGAVRPNGPGAVLSAVIRPHGAAVATYGVTAAFLAGSALARGAPLFALLWLAIVGAAAVVNLSSRLAERSAAIRAVLLAACGEPARAA